MKARQQQQDIRLPRIWGFYDNSEEVGLPRNVPPGQRTRHWDPTSVVACIGIDGEVHYGLLFLLPAEQVDQPLRPRTTGFPLSTHGLVSHWGVIARKDDAQQVTREVALLIPRTWLLLGRYLPARAILRRRKTFGIRNVSALLRRFVLETPELAQAEGCASEMGSLA